MLNKMFSSAICIFVLLTSFFEAYNILDEKYINDNNTKRVLVYYQEKDKEEEVEEINQYIGVLRIPKINLTRGFFPVSSPQNNLNKNIYFLKESKPINMIILAAHRGSSKVSFFNDLDKLSDGDEIFLDYKGKKYTYILNNRYDELKDGNLSIYRDETKDSLILITCNKFKNKYQTIYVAYKKGWINLLILMFIICSMILSGRCSREESDY